MKKTLVLVAALILILAAASMACAEDFTAEDYTFTWRVDREGSVNLALVKDPGGVKMALTGFGGTLAAVSLSPPDAAAVGKVMLKAGEQYKAHQKHFDDNKKKKSVFRKEYSVKELVGEYQVIFHSTPRGEKFTVKVGKAKTFASMVTMTKEAAEKLGGHLVKAEEMAAFINRRITL